MIGQGAAFDELSGPEERQFTVVQAEDRFVFFTIVVGRKALKFTATDEQAVAIALAIKQATQRGFQ